MKGKTKRILVVVVKWRHRANGLLSYFGPASLNCRTSVLSYRGYLQKALSSLEASLCCREAGEKKEESARGTMGPFFSSHRPSRAFSFSIVVIFTEIPSGSLCGGESPKNQANSQVCFIWMSKCVISLGWREFEVIPHVKFCRRKWVINLSFRYRENLFLVFYLFQFDKSHYFPENIF